MTMQEMITVYEEYSAADFYRIGFRYKHELYSMDFDELPVELLKLDYDSKTKRPKIRIRFKKADKEKFLASGKCVHEGSENLLEYDDKYTNGHHYEHYITEKYTQTKWEYDNIPFYVQGDINLDGKEVQIKFDSAELTNERCLTRLLEKMGKAI